MRNLSGFLDFSLVEPIIHLFFLSFFFSSPIVHTGRISVNRRHPPPQTIPLSRRPLPLPIQLQSSCGSCMEGCLMYINIYCWLEPLSFWRSMPRSAFLPTSHVLLHNLRSVPCTNTTNTAVPALAHNNRLQLRYIYKTRA